jgi:hypothetical protein
MHVMRKHLFNSAQLINSVIRRDDSLINKKPVPRNGINSATTRTNPTRQEFASINHKTPLNSKALASAPPLQKSTHFST